MIHRLRPVLSLLILILFLFIQVKSICQDKYQSYFDKTSTKQLCKEETFRVYTNDTVPFLLTIYDSLGRKIVAENIQYDKITQIEYREDSILISDYSRDVLISKEALVLTKHSQLWNIFIVDGAVNKFIRKGKLELNVNNKIIRRIGTLGDSITYQYSNDELIRRTSYYRGDEYTFIKDECTPGMAASEYFLNGELSSISYKVSPSEKESIKIKSDKGQNSNLEIYRVIQKKDTVSQYLLNSETNKFELILFTVTKKIED